jgi:putative hydrolase of the HAD superfamily
MQVDGRQFLIFDADDTLWENNIYFERAFDEFVAFLGHSTMSPRQVRDALDEIEHANSKIHGYGSLSFGRNLRECYRHLAEDHIREEDLETVMGFAQRILECPMEVIPGVRETLEFLAPRHDLTLFTKGHADEQKLKIDRSGLGRILRAHGDCEGEGPGGLPRAGSGARDGSGADVDDRELAQVGCEPGAGDGVECGVRAAPVYVVA